MATILNVLKNKFEPSFIREVSDWHMITDGVLSTEIPAGFESDLKVGDLVRWTNDYGVVWEHRIIGFAINDLCKWTPDKFVYLDTDSFWFPISLEKCELIK